MKTNEKKQNVVVYTCDIPTGYSQEAQRRDCLKALAKKDIRNTRVCGERFTHSGADFYKRRTLREFMTERRWRKLRGEKPHTIIFIAAYECLSTHPSEVVAIIKKLTEIGFDLRVLHEPKLYFHGIFRCGSALGAKAPWPTATGTRRFGD